MGAAGLTWCHPSRRTACSLSGSRGGHGTRCRPGQRRQGACGGCLAASAAVPGSWARGLQNVVQHSQQPGALIAGSTQDSHTRSPCFCHSRRSQKQLHRSREAQAALARSRLAAALAAAAAVSAAPAALVPPRAGLEGLPALQQVAAGLVALQHQVRHGRPERV